MLFALLPLNETVILLNEPVEKYIGSDDFK